MQLVNMDFLDAFTDMTPQDFWVLKLNVENVCSTYTYCM